MVYERILFDLNTTVEWEPCTRAECFVEGLDVHSGRLLVPSNYDRPLKKSFSLYVERYAKLGSHPEVHVILLAGGPGWSGEVERLNAIRLVNEYAGKVAAYLVDHRGLGGSGEFFLEGDVFNASPDALSETFKSSTFDIQDLIMTNAALDVSMLGMAIRKSTIPSARLVLHGFSYGARWAHHVVQLTPNLFDSAFLGGVPLITGVKDKISLVGLAEACANDEFCRRKMGGDVYKAMNSAVLNLGNKDYNECTTLFHESLSLTLTGTVGERTRELSVILYELLTNASGNLEKSEHFKPQQLLLPFLMATEKCTNTTRYYEKVLTPILKSLATSDGSFFKTNSIVNSAIMLDADYQDFWDGVPEPLSDHTDLHPIVYYPKSYYRTWENLILFLAYRKLSEERPAITSKTAIYIMASRMDLNTTYMSAWSLFKAITAPTKKWLLFGNRSHDGYWGKCHKMLEKEAILGIYSDFDYEACVREDDEAHRLDWNFSKYEKYSRMWDCVPDSADSDSELAIEVVMTNLPVYLELINVKGDYVLSSTALGPRQMLLFVVLLLLLKLFL